MVRFHARFATVWNVTPNYRVFKFIITLPVSYERFDCGAMFIVFVFYFEWFFFRSNLPFFYCYLVRSHWMRDTRTDAWATTSIVTSFFRTYNFAIITYFCVINCFDFESLIHQNVWNATNATKNATKQKCRISGARKRVKNLWNLYDSPRVFLLGK